MISIKTPEEIETMREGGKILAHVLQEVAKRIQPGVTTQELDRAAEALILESGVQLAFKGYEDFPGAICTSVNDEVVHSVPGNRVLKEGDIITLDMGLIFKGYYLDMARTFPVGAISPEAQHLIDVTKEALRIGREQARIGNKVGDIGEAVQTFVEAKGYGVVRELCGHGIGKELHEDPKVPNFGKKGTGPELVQGMVICIEPMITAGEWKLMHAADGHGYQTKDAKLSCHFEDTIAITKNGPQILTRFE